jgi:hypothetical protein
VNWTICGNRETVKVYSCVIIEQDKTELLEDFIALL